MANYGTMAFEHSAGTTNMLSGNLSGTGTILLNGGTLIMTGTNLYNGATAVSNGTLLVNGIHGGAGMITVYTNATLGGGGELRSMVSVQNGGVLSPGNSPGTLTVTTNVTFEAGATYAVELAATNSYDRLQFTGGYLTINDAYLHVDLSFPAAIGDTFTIVGGAGAPLTQVGQFASNTPTPFQINPTSGYTNTLLQVAYNTGDSASDITLTVIPEPATFGLLALFALAALLRRKNRATVGR
jgi:fibronectin-binding autotransporter adhesin